MALELGEAANDIKAWLAGLASIGATVFGIVKLRQHATEKREERIVTEATQAADMKAMAVQQTKHHEAIIDLYGKHDTLKDKIAELDRNNWERHTELLNAIGELRRG